MIPNILFLLMLMLLGCAGESNDGQLAKPKLDSPSQSAPGQEKKDPPAPTPPDDPVPATTPPPPMLAWNVSGTLADGGIVSGSLSYSAGAVPDLTNENNLVPNSVYTLPTWTVSITETSTHPALTFSNTNSTATLCVGNCVFAAPPTERLIIKNGSYTLQLVFLLPEGVSLPVMLENWGPVYLPAAWLKSVQYVILVRTELIELGA